MSELQNLRLAKASSGISACLARQRDLIFNIHQSIVLSNPLTSTWAARLQMTRSQANGQISNEIVLSLSGSVGYENAPAVTVRQFCPVRFALASTQIPNRRGVGWVGGLE